MEQNLFRYVWRKSKGEQIVVLLIILASIPFYFISFDVPKRIVNDAIQGRAFTDGKTTANLFDLTIPAPDFLGGPWHITDGIALTQVQYLLGLSLFFLLLVLINGGFKYLINLQKGILGERMLRRMRYDLFVQLLHFRPEDIRAVKPSEAASMIKDEVEPIGGFVGDAFIQPAYLIMQAGTALIFILMQSVWLGSIAAFIVMLQAVIIPSLRREQLRLGRERQLASRHLAGRIGEIVDVAPSLQGHGTLPYMQSDISDRLGKLFKIRYDLYQRKFAVKFLNNLLAQITPFFFYAVGGYFALKGKMDLGQLLAVIAAYRDLPTPIKELIDWDQQRNDVVIKYEQVVSQFTPPELLRSDDDKTASPVSQVNSVAITQIQVTDQRGQTLLDSLTLTLPESSCMVLAGQPGSGSDVLGRVLGRQLMSYSGKVMLDKAELAQLSVRNASHLIGYAGPEIDILQGTLRDNFALSLQRSKPSKTFDRDTDPGEYKRVAESLRSGNTPLRYTADWLDYKAAGIGDGKNVDDAIRDILHVLGVENELYELGLTGRVRAEDVSETERLRLATALIEAREAVSEELRSSNLTDLVELFDQDGYNINATIGENLIFGSTTSDRLSRENFMTDPFMRAILQAEALNAPLISIGAQIVTTLVEVLSVLPPGHQMFDRYALAQVIEQEALVDLAEKVNKQNNRYSFDPETERQLVAIALGYIEPRHRLNLIDTALCNRILRARSSVRAFLPRDYADDIAFYDKSRFMFGATVRDNLLFGRVGYGIANANARISEVVKAALTRKGLDSEIYRLGLNVESGTKGRFLPARLRLAVPLVRALIKHPSVCILDLQGLLNTSSDPAGIVDRIRAYCAGKILVLLVQDAMIVKDADIVVTFDGTQGTVVAGTKPVDAPLNAQGSILSGSEPQAAGAQA